MVSLARQDDDARTRSSGQTVLRSDEEEMKKFSSIQMDLEGTRSEQQGDLIISTKRLLWAPSNDNSEAQPIWNEEFKNISMHAISTDAANDFPPCIYAQVGEDCQEVRFIPVEGAESVLQEIYDAMCSAAELNASDDEGAGEGLISSFMNPNFVGEMIPEGNAAATARRLDSLLQVPEDLEQSPEQNGSENENNEHDENPET